MQTKTHIDDQLISALRARGQRVTPQRLLLNRALRELDRHVSAEELKRPRRTCDQVSRTKGSPRISTAGVASPQSSK